MTFSRITDPREKAQPLRVLQVDDSAPDAELVLWELRAEGYAPAAERVASPEAMATALETQVWDVIIAADIMPEFSGRDALRLVQAKALDIPLIIISSIIGEDIAVDAVRAGARDYVVKSFLKRLGPAVKREVEEAKLRKKALEIREHAEMVLRRYYEELEQRVAKRTAELRETNALLNNEIAERIKGEEELRLLSTAVESAANGIVITDRDGRIIWSNPALTRMTGYAREETIGQNPRIFKSGQQTPEFYQTLWATICSGQTWHGQIVNRRKDGTHYTEELTITPVRAGGNEEITHFVAIKEDISARKQAEQERERLLLEVQRRATELDAIIDAIVDPTAAFNTNGVLIRANPAMVLTIGHDPVGMTYTEIARMLSMRRPDGTLLEETEIPICRALRGEPVVGERLLVTDCDGHVMIVLISAAPLLEQDRPWGVVSIWHDISKRERLLEEVQRRAAELDATFDAVLDPMISFNEQDIIIHTNPAMRSRMGCDPLGLTYTEYAGVMKLHFPDGRALQAEELPSYRALQGEMVVGERFIMTGADGHDRVLQISATPIATDGHRWGAVAIGHDITDLEHLIDEVQRRVAELDATLASLADGLIIYSPTGEILLDNPAAQTLLDGVLLEEEYGGLPQWLSRYALTPDGKRLTPEHAPGARAARGETVTGAQLVFRCKDGADLYTSVTAAPIRQRDGSIIGVVSTYTDITQLHELQVQREVYIHTISHDLRAPLAVIRGHAELVREELQQQGLDGLLVPSVTAILQGTVSMNVMIQDLVDAARLEGGQLKLDRKPVDMRHYLNTWLQQSVTAMDVGRIHVEVADELPLVSADANRLERIFINLLSNSLKFSEPGSPVFVRVYRVEQQVEVSITDQGRGIDPEDLPHLFERFYRAKSERKTEGVGLGLYITGMLVKAHQGRIWVTSEVGKGSTFFFTLPIV